VEEWASVDFHEPRGKIVLFLLAVILVGALLGRCRWKLEELGLVLFAVYFGLVHVRFLFQAAILLAPILAKMLDFMPPYRREIDKPVLNAVIFGGILAIMAFRFPTEAQLAEAAARRYPVDALTYVKSHGLPGRIFNLYIWGGFLTWRSPEVKTFIDSRADIFEYTGILQDYLEAISLTESLRVLDKHQINYVLMPPKNPLTYLLKHTPGWRVVYSDSICTIMERVSSPSSQASEVRAAGSQKSP